MRNHNPYVSRRRLQRAEVAGRKITKYGIALSGIVIIGAFLRPIIEARKAGTSMKVGPFVSAEKVFNECVRISIAALTST